MTNVSAAAHNALMQAHALLARTEHGPDVIAQLERAIQLAPHWDAPLVMLGELLIKQRMYNPALQVFQRLMRLNPDDWRAYFGTGVILHDLNRPEDARGFYATALELAPDQAGPLANLLRLMTSAGEAAASEPLITRLNNLILDGKRGATPLLVTMTCADGDTQRRAAELHTANLPKPPPLTTLRTPPRNGKIRLGFLTDDLRNHPVGHLMVGLFEHLDTSRFELVIFAYGTHDDDITRRCKTTACEWHDVEALAPTATAHAIAAANIDILIDLKGHTQNARPDVYTYRPAPVTVNFLGYPATMGHPAWDYLIADPFIIPAGHERFYSEKIVRLSGCYQPNDPKRPLPLPLARQAYGLPDEALVLVSFNQPQKFSRPLLGAWMRILRNVHDAVLWLRDFSEWPTAKQNLQAFAQQHDVAPHRLIFAPRAETHSLHLARYGAADLALDTYPYNSQTTASDALWMGCPLLTLPGEAFASRVAGSLLQASGLTDLIAPDWDAYTVRAIELGHDKPRLAGLRAHLTANRHTFDMFDTLRYTRCFESALAMMHQRRLDGLAPDHLSVAAPLHHAA